MLLLHVVSVFYLYEALLEPMWIWFGKIKCLNIFYAYTFTYRNTKLLSVPFFLFLITVNVLKFLTPRFLNNTNSVDPDQTAPEGAVWSEFTLFAVPLSIFINAYFCPKTIWSKVFEFLGHLPYSVVNIKTTSLIRPLLDISKCGQRNVSVICKFVTLISFIVKLCQYIFFLHIFRMNSF